MNGFAGACRIDPEPSRRLAVLLGIGYGGALLLAATGLTGLLRALCLAGILCSAAWTCWRHFGPGRIVHAEQLEAERWQLRRADGWEGEARLLPSSLVTPALMVLNFRFPGVWQPWRRGQSLCLLPDSLDRDSARRLRVFLRFQ
ncbi:MAG: protein YgfX [Candidatus Macondimonas sp.]